MARKKNRKHSRHFMSSVTACISTTMVLILPFISYGGSNLVAMFAFTGLLINCVRNWSKPAQIRASEL